MCSESKPHTCLLFLGATGRSHADVQRIFKHQQVATTGICEGVGGRPAKLRPARPRAHRLAQTLRPRALRAPATFTAPCAPSAASAHHIPAHLSHLNPQHSDGVAGALCGRRDCAQPPRAA